jgi:hypothetical protein
VVIGGVFYLRSKLEGYSTEIKLEIPESDCYLGVGSALHTYQTGENSKNREWVSK